jgi:hypothetical protein
MPIPYRHAPYSSIDSWFENHIKPRIIMDSVSNLRRIGDACGLKRSEVRSNLPRLGYIESKTVNGVKCWRLMELNKE